MLIEYLAYIITFVLTTGIAVVGIMISFFNYQTIKKPVLSTLLYQQIFLFSFFMYGIWGNIALHQIIADLSISEAISNRLTFFVPIIGIPFMIVSWFMLIKFGMNSNGYKITNTFIVTYFCSFVVVLLTLSYLVQKGIIPISGNPDLFVVRLIVVLNIIVHLIFLIPFILSRSKAILKEIQISSKWILYYLGGVVMYSFALFFFPVFGYIFTCVSIIMLFALSIILPVRIKLSSDLNKSGFNNISFASFCEFYEISKREAEIIQEICTGKSNKAIADKLYISLQTVKDHNHRIYTKTGVKSRVQLANLVREKTDNVKLSFDL